MDIKLKSYIFITCSLIGGALFPIAFKAVDNNNVNIFAFIFLAYLIATIVSLALVLAKKKTGRLIEYIKNPKEFLFIGILGFINLAFVDYGLIYAEKFISASLATVIYRTQPLLMLIFIPLVLREKVSKIQIAALMLAFLGIYVALGAGSLSLFLGADTGIILFLVIMTLAAAFATVVLKRYTTDMESTMFIFNFVALIVAFGLFLHTGAQLPVLSPISWTALLYVGIIANMAVPFFYYSAFRALKTTFVTNLYFLSPFITILFAGALLQEPIYPYYLVIAVLVAIGLFIQRFDKKGGTYLAKSKDSVKNYLQIFDVTSAFLNTKVDAISSTMKGNGRVLAVKLDNELYNKIKEPERYDAGPSESVFIYTNSDRRMVSEDENRFILEILEVGQNETVLLSAGKPETSEEFFNDIQHRLETKV